MKNVLLYLSIVFYSGVIFLFSCKRDILDESIPLNPVLIPIKAAVAIDGGTEVRATISDRDKTITFELENLKNLKEVEVVLHISKRAELLFPLDTLLTLDLTEPYEITINNLYENITYTISASIPEYIITDKMKYRAYDLDNDTPPRNSNNMKVLWDGEIMYTPGTYANIGYRNYETLTSFTFDIGTRYDGSYYYLKQFKASLYWAYENLCPKEYELWGYLLPGLPPISGDWNDWTKLAEIDNSTSILADFENGDNIYFEKDDSPSVRYLRLICRSNYRPDPPFTAFSLCEITFWAWNK